MIRNRIKQLGKVSAAVMLCAASIAGMAGCAGKNTKPLEPPPAAAVADETPVTIRMYGNLDATYLPLLERMQEEFPEIALEYEFQWDEAYFHEPERRILHKDGPDLFTVRGDALSSMSEKGYLLDLTGEDFSTRYHVSTMSSLNDDGRIFGLPLPSDIRCLLCNRAILKEHGIEELPQTVPELVDICRKLTSEGQGGIIIETDVYIMLLYTSWLYGPEGYDWLTAYNAGEAVMAGTPAETAWRRLYDLVESSGCTPEDSSALPARRTKLMLEGKYAFRLTNISNLSYMLNEQPDMDLVALPYLGETEQDQWVYYIQPVSLRYFAANAALDRPENAAKKECVLRLLDWLSTPEIQALLASCGGSSASYVDNVPNDGNPLMEYMQPVIEEGRLTNCGYPERGVISTVSDCTAKMLAGEMTLEDAVSACDAQNAAYIPPQDIPGLDEVIGYAQETVYWRKPAAVTLGSPMAQLAAMAMSEAFPEADLSFAMAKNTATTLYAGAITLKERWNARPASRTAIWF